MISSPTNDSLAISDIRTACGTNLAEPVWHFHNSQEWQRSDQIMGWLPKITSLEPDKGYWVYMRDSCTFAQTGKPRPDVSGMNVVPGWNLVSVPIKYRVSIDYITGYCGDKLYKIGDKTLVWHFNSTTQNWNNPNDLEYLEPGTGYYIGAYSGCYIPLSDSAQLPFSATTTTHYSTTTSVYSSTTVTYSTTTSSLYSGTTTTLPTCKMGCGDAEPLPRVDLYSMPTCNIAKGSNSYYKINVTSDRTVNATVIPKTYNDMDLYVFGSNDGLSDACGDLLCSSTLSGTATDSCLFSASAFKNYYIRVNAYGGAVYADNALATLRVENLR